MPLHSLLCVCLVLVHILSCAPSIAGTIAEKAASLELAKEDVEQIQGLASLNQEMKLRNQQLQLYYEEAVRLREQNCEDAGIWNDLRHKIIEVRDAIHMHQKLWAEEVAAQNNDPDDYAFWSHLETTVYNLVSDYGDDRSVYIIPQDIGKIRVSSLSKLLVPKESFEECLSLLLSRLGIGIHQVSPWLKELYIMQKDGSNIAGLFSSKDELEVLPETAHIGFVLTTKNMDAKSDVHVLKRFANTVQIDLLGGKLWLFGSVGEIQELLKIYDFIQSDNIRQESKIVPLVKIHAAEMVAILKAAFRDDFKEADQDSASGLRIVPLQHQGNSLFISGASSLVNKAVALIQELEGGMESPSDKIVFWYNVKHSDPQELACLLSQIHDVYAGKSEGGVDSSIPISLNQTAPIHIDTTVTSSEIKNSSVKYGSFIADPKTGSLIMVVEKDALPTLKMLLKKLDVPKKMVRIEVLLFERKLSHQRQSGLNLLRLGESLNKGVSAGISWTSGGILDFLLKGSTGASIVPGYDLAYQFLMAQENVRINASPCVVTMNQTPARIAIVEEMSIAVASEKEKSHYNRAQYGIMIKLLPIINMDEEDGKSFITMETDITFDTTGKNEKDRPNVTRRNITNKVRIADGETIIIGGLRCKHVSDTQNGVPFLGDIPGVGKLFGMDASTDSQTEMFVFITPKILTSSLEQKERQEEQSLAARPGEPEEFLQAIACGEQVATAMQKKHQITTYATNRSREEGNEYDGR